MDRRTHTRLIAAFVFVATVLLSGCSATGTSAQQGVFALRGQVNRISSQLTATSAPDGVSVQIVQYMGKDPIRAYDLDLTKPMHIIVISDDFSSFQHLHPSLSQDGTFSVDVPIDPAKRYYLYADSIPRGLNQHVFRFTLGNLRAFNRVRSIGPSSPSAIAGAYTVKLSSTTLPQDQPAQIAVTIHKNGKLAHDIAPYLGAAAHVVLINESDLSYTHVHPVIKGAPMPHQDAMSGMAGMPGMSDGEMGPAKAGPELTLYVPPLPRGAYAAWIQFQGGGKVYSVPFTFVAQGPHGHA